MTTYAEITTALNEDKIPVIIVNNKIYIYTQSSGSGFYNFNYVDGNAVHYYNIDTSDIWTSFTWTNEATNNKVTSLTQYSSNTQYPSAKCVYDALATKVTSVNNITPVNGNVSLSIPTATSDLTNDSGYITGITSSDVTTALGYTPYNSSNPSGYQANIIETVKVNGTAQTVTSKAVNITVPTKTSDLTNDSGYTSNVGTVTSVNNVQPDSSGNVTISVSGGANTDLSNLTSTGNNLVNTALNTRDNSTRLKFWTGTKAQYDAISTKDSNTLYNITDDQDITLTLLQTIYPVGSVYLSTNSTCPLASLFGTWTLVSSGKALWTGTGSNGGSTISAGLPNIMGTIGDNASLEKGPVNTSNFTGAFSADFANKKGFTSASSSASNPVKVYFNASNSNSIYGNSTTVQPPAYVVNVWRRTA